MAAARNVYNSVAPVNLHWAISQATHRVDLAAMKMEAALDLVLGLEARLQITARWTPSSEEYKKYFDENVRTEYQKTIDELERLVVMRLFELTKMNSSGTGLSLHSHFNYRRFIPM